MVAGNNAVVRSVTHEYCCRRAVYNTGNSGVESAMAWVMDHMGDPDFSDPFTPPGSSGGAGKYYLLIG